MFNTLFLLRRLLLRLSGPREFKILILDHFNHLFEIMNDLDGWTIKLDFETKISTRSWLTLASWSRVLFKFSIFIAAGIFRFLEIENRLPMVPSTATVMNFLWWIWIYPAVLKTRGAYRNADIHISKSFTEVAWICTHIIRNRERWKL